VRVSAADGYRAVYSLAELDPAMHDGDVILADTAMLARWTTRKDRSGSSSGDDKRPARWVRQLKSIDLVAAPGP
jgi:hypothetical protein